MKQQHILNTAREQGKQIGHDGALLPELADLIEEDDEQPCPCNGTGEIEVRFGGRVIEVLPCQRGCES